MPGYTCVFRGCSSKTGGGLALFSFPKDHDRAKLWLEACCRTDLLSKNVKELRRNYKLCELHFEDRYYTSGSSRKRLLPIASPTLFPHTQKRACESKDLQQASPRKVSKIITILSDPLKIEPTFMNEVPSVIISETQGRNTDVEHTRTESQGCVSQTLRGNTTSELSPNLCSIDYSPDPNNAKLEIEQEEDASNAEEFLTKQADSELYCRLCLCVSQDSNSYINIFPSGTASSTRQQKIQQMLQDIIPDLDLTLTYNPGICSDCEARLIGSYDFISLCTQNQDTLRNYKSKSAGPFVNIQAVVEAHNPTKKRKMIASSAKGKKQKTTLAKGINEDAVSESGNRNVSSLTSDPETTIEHIEIKVEEDPDIHQDSHEYFESMEGIGDQNAFIQSYSILTEQADDRLSLYETASNIPASLDEETDHVIAEHTQPIIDNIQSDVSTVRSESVNIGNVPLNVGSRFGIKIVEPRTYGSKSKSNNSAKK